MAGISGSYHGTPYTLSEDGRSGTFDVTNPEDGSHHNVKVTRSGSGRMDMAEIDGHYMSTINTFATAEQLKGIEKLKGLIHGAERYITSEYNKANGVEDPAEATAKKAKAEKDAAARKAAQDKAVKETPTSGEPAAVACE